MIPDWESNPQPWCSVLQPTVPCTRARTCTFLEPQLPPLSSQTLWGEALVSTLQMGKLRPGAYSRLQAPQQQAAEAERRLSPVDGAPSGREPVCPQGSVGASTPNSVKGEDGSGRKPEGQPRPGPPGPGGELRVPPTRPGCGGDQSGLAGGSGCGRSQPGCQGTSRASWAPPETDGDPEPR